MQQTLLAGDFSLVLSCLLSDLLNLLYILKRGACLVIP